MTTNVSQQQPPNGPVPVQAAAADDVVDVNLTPSGSSLKADPKAAGRMQILAWLGASFFVTVVGAVLGATLCPPDRWQDIKSMLDLLVPAETALLGVAVAFFMT